MKKVKLELGQTVVTQGVASEIEINDAFVKFIADCMGRYILFDWGDMCEEDKSANNRALSDGERIVAKYNFPEDMKVSDGVYDDGIYIITEWDRSVTTILFPSEY